MKLSNVMFLSAIVLGTATANPALAQASIQESTPNIWSVFVLCEPLPKAIGAVKVNFNMGAVGGLVYEFRNVSTGQTITSAQASASVFWADPSGAEARLPPGTYDLTVKRPSNLHSRSQWVNIVVPVAVSTNGGTGCRFLGPGEMPAVPTPLKR